ncbi:hypothetical protein TELCIR_15916 [Teladorsagia circumcincta]|uniref:Uncharacterized protein n=1 Tax=Teladorsagia circumcincta TaxID=45464 RepID=A0A2G9TWX8_TELCI|nr:hypothetical protein TELCIR_15916 [Teladorsagia circumcincta]
MFDQIDELAEDDRCMVFVLIDEIESLGMSRDASTSRGDPADSIRAVNALLTQIDRIRRRTNVIVLCTSNMEGCLDRALLDRADVVRHVGQPSANALYSILAKCVDELIRIGLVVSDQQLPSIRELKTVESECSPGRELMELATLALGLSGRSIRQVPALAWSKADEDTVSLSTCLSLFREAIMEKTELRR